MKFMSKKDIRVFLLSIAITIVLAITLSVTGVLQKPLAIYRATIHVMLNYWNQGLRYYDAELVTAMSSYKVTFIREDGSTEYISVSPYEFPIHIMFDSQNPGG